MNQIRFFSSSALADSAEIEVLQSCSAADAMCSGRLPGPERMGRCSVKVWRPPRAVRASNPGHASGRMTALEHGHGAGLPFAHVELIWRFRVTPVKRQPDQAPSGRGCVPHLDAAASLFDRRDGRLGRSQPPRKPAWP